MDLIRYPQLRALNDSTCVTVGNFDGVHLGHQTLIKKTVVEARERGCNSVVVSMQPLPLQYFNGPNTIEILTPFKQKYQLIKDCGVDVFCLLNFNAHLSSMSAADFFEQILVNGLNAEYIVLGDDFRFGANRQGDLAFMKQLANQKNIQVEKVPSVVCNRKRISSTNIRLALGAGDFAYAKSMLGRDFNFMGRVATGQKLGRKLGYPTINLALKSGGFSLHGIYVVAAVIAGKKHQAVASVGFNPSVGGNAKRIEVYVLDFNQQIYGQCVEVLFYKKLRNEVEFESLEKLTAAIEDDVRATRKYFADL